MMHQMLGHEKSKIENSANLQIRNKLQIQARKIQAKAYKIINKESSLEDKCIMLGEITSYVETRKILMPSVGSDGYTQELKGAMNKLKALISA